MKHQGGCHCGQFTFQTELEPMLVVQCNCSNCRKMTGSINLGCLYAATEIETSGETNSYEFTGGSGYNNTAHFCTNCYVRVMMQPAKEVMEGMVGLPLGTFENAKSISPKIQIWTSEKLDFLTKPDSGVEESFEDSGIPERLMAVLANMEDR